MAEATNITQRLADANGDELVEILANASAEDEIDLRAVLGADCHSRLRNRAIRAGMLCQERARVPSQSREHLVIIPGLLGTELFSVDTNGQREIVWLDAPALVQGKLPRLALADNGFADADPRYHIQPGGVIKRYYGDLMLSLAHAFRVDAFAYDWRKSLDLIATEFYTFLRQRFPQDEVVHIVAVGEGGLIARLVQSRHAEALKGRLLFLGSPVYGSPVFVQALAGHNELVNWADTLDTGHGAGDFLALARSMPSLYQLLPSPSINPEWEALYRPQSYGAEVEMRPALLAQARSLRIELDRAPLNAADTICVVGFNQPTVADIDIPALLRSQTEKPGSPQTEQIYSQGNGDGRTPCPLADQSGWGVQTFYADCGQQPDLLTAPRLLAGLADLLLVGSPEARTSVAERLGLQAAPESVPVASDGEAQTRQRVKGDLLRAKLDNALAGWRTEASRKVVMAGQIAATEKGRMIEDVLARLYVFDSIETDAASQPPPSFPPIRVKVDVKLGDIAKATSPTYDAIVVGNYLGEEPQGPFAALENGLTVGKEGQKYAHLFAELIQRNAIRSELAALFLIPDPRPRSGATLVVAGQGTPGRFGLPELKILVRELCWTLKRLGKHKIATVLLGDGRGGESIDEVIAVWMRGIKGALTGLESSDEQTFSITFIQHNPRKTLEMDAALRAEVQKHEGRMTIDYSPLTPAELRKLQSEQNKRWADELSRKRKEQLQLIQEYLEKGVLHTGTSSSKAKSDDLPPTRLHVEWGDTGMRFGALTSAAAIAERETEISLKTVVEENDALAASPSREMRAHRGEILARLLLPTDLLAHIAGEAPLVVSVDSTTARVHWELLRLPSDLDQNETDRLGTDHFLGLGRGLTRQLRTTLAPRPEIVPPRKRQLRVLVVADPAADARLAGAQEEGVAVADLFELVNRLDGTENRVEVVRLIGPNEATHSNVLGELLTRTYDVLHFAGHCRYDPQKPSNSGWLFTGDTLLTPQEIQRTGRMPAFVFSNACESGVTPDRSGDRSVGLAPSFAESFFAKGVTNFICTGWPVHDRAARDFALVLYADLLGLNYAPEKRTSGPASRINPACYAKTASEPGPIYAAMRKARTEIEQSQSDDGRSWGAYQHYGNPYARLFASIRRTGGT